MPLYEYKCESCMRVIEVMQKLDDPPVDSCGECGGSVRKLFHPVGTVFKGSGFYVNDSKAAKGDKTTKCSDPAPDNSKPVESPSPCATCDKSCPAAGTA